jgi:hypothetical protein
MTFRERASRQREAQWIFPCRSQSLTNERPADGCLTLNRRGDSFGVYVVSGTKNMRKSESSWDGAGTKRGAAYDTAELRCGKASCIRALAVLVLCAGLGCDSSNGGTQTGSGGSGGKGGGSSSGGASGTGGGNGGSASGGTGGSSSTGGHAGASASGGTGGSSATGGHGGGTATGGHGGGTATGGAGGSTAGGGHGGGSSSGGAGGGASGGHGGATTGAGGQGGAGDATGSGGGGGSSSADAGTLCSGKLCKSDQFCCGPPACGFCANLAQGPNCQTTCN